MNFTEDEVFVKVTDIEGNRGILHPKGGMLRFIEDEEHPVVIAEALAVHEAFLGFFRGDGDLYLERYVAKFYRVVCHNGRGFTATCKGKEEQKDAGIFTQLTLKDLQKFIHMFTLM